MVSPNRPRIAIVTIHPLNYGGVLTVLRVVYQFCSRFFEPTLFFPSFNPKLSQSIRSPFTKATIKKTEYFGMPSIEIGTRWASWEPGHYQYTKDLWQQALEGYDCCFVVSGTVLAAHPLVLLKKKFVLWAATTYEDDRAIRKQSFSLPRKLIDNAAQTQMRIIEKEILLKANEIGAMSSYTQQAFENIRINHHPKIHYISVPVAPAPELPQKINTENKIIIAVGRFDDPRKNAAMLFAAFEHIYAAYTNAQLIIIGNSPSQNIIDQYAQKPCFDAITITGHVSDEELKQWYRQADLMLITSYQEGLGIIGLEAMAHGVPVVSTDCGGPRDFVYPQKNGFLVPINDIVAMKKAALTILQDEQLAQNMRHHAYEYVVQKASWKKTEESFQRMLCDTYPELVNLFIQEKTK